MLNSLHLREVKKESEGSKKIRTGGLKKCFAVFLLEVATTPLHVMGCFLFCVENNIRSKCFRLFRALHLMMKNSC